MCASHSLIWLRGLALLKKTPCWRFPTSVSAQRAVLPKLHLKILKQILGVRKTVHTDIVWKTNPIKRLEDIFGQPIIKFWNNLSVAPSTSLYRLITLASCHAAVTRMCIIGHGPSIEVCVLVDTCLTLRVDELDPIAEVTFNSLMRDHRDVGWQGLP